MTENGNSKDVFLTRLRSYQRAWQRGLALALGLRIAGWFAVAIAGYFLADYFLALDESVRTGLDVLIPLAIAVIAAPEVLRIARLGLDDTAEHVDLAARFHRKNILTARELLGTAPLSEASAAALPRFLVERSVAEAADRLAQLKPDLLWPRALLGTRMRQLAVRAAVVLALALACGGEALSTVARRLAFPRRDIPPFSHCRFAVTPDKPVVIYGGSSDVSVALTGAPSDVQVWMLTRQGRRKIQRSACFQDGNGRYGQRLESITSPVEFCFAAGRARSRWHAVDVQFQPQVVQARLRVEPPAYTRLPPREFLAGQEELSGVRGTRVSLTLTSNRPLRDGTLTLKRGAMPQAEERVIEGKLTSERIVLFTWTLQDDAEVKAVLRDLQGTPTAQPVALRQKRLPDEPPKARLIEPPEYAMATPGATLRVAGQAEDDFGLARLDWVRTVAGFNDRALTLNSGAIGARTEFEKTVDLGALGVQPGQTLEFYLEALDNNPSLPGVGASGVSHVKVISEDEYAEMLRNRETLDDFLERFEAASKTVDQIIASLEASKPAMSEHADAAAALKRLVVEHMAAEALFQQLAREFSVYDVERALAQTSASVQGKLGEDRLELEDLMRTQGKNGATTIEGMIRRLKGDAESLGEQKQAAERVALLAKVMDCGARYQALVQRQSDLVRRLKQHYGEKVSPQDLPFLGGYGDEQADLARDLATLTNDTAAAAAALPEDFKKLNRDTQAFLEYLNRSGASDNMAQAVVASRNTDAAKSLREATLALEKLESLLRNDACGSDNAFCGMCRGQQPDFGPDSLKKTLRDMFSALCRKHGIGKGSGSAAGGGGTPEGASGYSELGVPVYGPGRASMSRSGEGRGKIGESGRGEWQNGAGGRPSVEERVRRADAQKPAGEAVPFERLPAKYREAVKRYFQDEAGGNKK